jgi:hypothetical protein
MPNTLAGLPVRSTRNLINPDTRICMMLWAYAKRGKTTMGRSLDAFTKKYMGKPSLFIAVEAGEGGGTMSIQDADIDYVCPTTMDELNRLIAELHSNSTYGGIVLDSASEYVNRFLKPYALKFPYTKGAPPATRLAGVPEQGDYQTMGERARSDFNQLINLTTHPDPKIRKHLLVTALEMEKKDRDGNVLRIGPALPGAMMEGSTSMFQTVGTIELRTIVGKDALGKPTRTTERTLVTDATEENKKILGDRTKCIRSGMPLDFVQIWEQGFLPAIESRKEVTISQTS